MDHTNTMEGAYGTRTIFHDVAAVYSHAAASQNWGKSCCMCSQ